MLKRKLDERVAALNIKKPATLDTAEQYYQVEDELNIELDKLDLPDGIACVYNPVQYAEQIHRNFLRKYLNGTKKVVFVGINPGPQGMCQTGVPFGNVKTVRDKMQLTGEVHQPAKLHPKRPITGFACKTEEPSGCRLWELCETVSGDLDTFFKQCFVHNLCPLAFFDEKGVNITPDCLKGAYKVQIRDKCLEAFEKLLLLLQPDYVVAVGGWVETELKKKSAYCKTRAKVIRLKHPSRRVRNNENWNEDSKIILQNEDLIKFMCNKV